MTDDSSPVRGQVTSRHPPSAVAPDVSRETSPVPDSDVSRETDVDAALEAETRARLLARHPAAADQLDRYAAHLADAGVVRGLVGPREVGRVWHRHLANSAVLEELVTSGARVVDVGSGAGLPGLPLALVRPDLHVVLVEPLLRRATYLDEVVALLGVGDRVEVVRSRAEDVREPLGDVVTARAVAPLSRLVGWTLPLVSVGGELLALKGGTAADEAREAGPAVQRLGGGPAEIVQCGAGVVDPPTTVVRIRRLHAGNRGGAGRRARRGSGGAA